MSDNSIDRHNVKSIEPTLFIGLGGTGVEIVSRIRRKLNLLYSELKPEELELIQYLTVDTRPYGRQDIYVQEGLDPDRHYLYFGGFNPAEEIENQYEQNKDLQNWWDKNAYTPNEVLEYGASRERMLGRLCLYRNRNRLRDELDTKIRASNDLEDKLQGKGRLAAGSNRCRIYIITGSCGGTGSSMYLDVSHMVWRIADSIFGNPPEITAIILLPFIHARQYRRINPNLETIYLANGYAFLRELDYFLKYPDQINDYCCDAVQRHTTGLPDLSNWRPFHQAYLIDDRISNNVGQIRELRDLYSYIARALFHWYITPEQTLSAAILSNIKALLETGRDHLFNEPKAFSCMGISTLEYPRQVILDYLRNYYASDILSNAILKKEEWMTESAKKVCQGGGGEKGWADHLGRDQLKGLSEVLDNEIRNITNASPKADSFKKGDSFDHEELIKQIRQAVDTVETVVQNASVRFVDTYNRFFKTANSEMETRIRELFDTSEHGINYVREILIQTDNLLCEDLTRVRNDISKKDSDFKKLKDKLLNGKDLGSIDYIKSAKDKLFGKDKNLIEAIEKFADDLKSFLAVGLEREAAECKEKLIIDVAGDPKAAKVTEVRTMDAASSYQVELSLLDRWVADIRELAAKLENIASELTDNTKLNRYYSSGSEITTEYIPKANSIEALEKNEGIRNLYSSKVDNETEELKNILSSWLADPGKSMKFHDFKRDAGVLVTLKELLYQRAEQLFAKETAKSIHQHLGQLTQHDREVYYKRLVDLSSPSCSLDESRLDLRDRDDISTIWSLGSEIDIRQNLPGTLQDRMVWGIVGPDTISLVTLRHGFSLYIIEGMDDLHAAYTSVISNSRLCPHIQFQWNTGGLQDGEKRAGIMISEDAKLYFTLGLFVDLLTKSESTKQIIQSMFFREHSFAVPQFRGFVYRSEGKYYAYELSQVEINDSVLFRIDDIENLGADRSEALSRFHKRRDMIEAFKQFMEILQGKIEQKTMFDELENFYNAVKESFNKAEGRPEEQSLIDSLGRALHNFKEKFRPVGEDKEIF